MEHPSVANIKLVCVSAWQYGLQILAYLDIEYLRSSTAALYKIIERLCKNLLLSNA